jgi:tetratricopeptide (TPR) repeat protein
LNDILIENAFQRFGRSVGPPIGIGASLPLEYVFNASQQEFALSVTLCNMFIILMPPAEWDASNTINRMKPTFLILALIACLAAFSFQPSPVEMSPSSTPDALIEALPVVAVAAFEDEDSIVPRPVLLSKSGTSADSSAPLRMNELRIDVKVIGNMATTTLEMNFVNDLDRILEGQLIFPLNEGQTVSRFAMDVNGKLREGVIVEKQKGQQVFETIVRRNVDPGLLEWTKGNNFRARVYPIPAKGNKRILVAYEQELNATQEGPLYLLPMNFPDLLDKFDLKVEVFRQEVKPELQDNGLANLKFDRWEENYVAEIHKTRVKADRQLGFMVPKPKRDIPVYVEKGSDGSNYFYFHMNPKVQSSQKPVPKHITLLWDASSSGQKRDHDREMALLEACFARYQNLQVDLVTFAVDAENPLTTQVSNGQWRGLQGLLQGMAYDGATQLGCLDLSKYKTDEFYLFSDGISNFGTAEIKTGGKPVHCISSGPDAEYAILRNLADETGGSFISLRETNIEDAMPMLASNSYRFLGLRSATGAESVYPDRPASVQREFSMAGKMTDGKAKLVLEFGIGSKVMETQIIQLDAAEANESSNLVSRIWAQKKLAALERDPKRNEKAMVELGKSHGLVTRYTSLIVLETLEDYLEFDIVPPAEMRDDFMASRAKTKKSEEDAVEEHLEMVLELWKERKKWWDKKIDWAKLKPLSAKNGKGAQMDSLSMNVEEITTNGSAAAESFDGSSDDWDDEGDAFGDFDEEIEVVEEEVDFKSEEKENEKGRKRNGKISIKAWDPSEPYLDAIKKANSSKQYDTYLTEKAEFGDAPSFYLDCTDFFLSQKDDRTALRILSNIAEMQLEDYRLIRILAHRLLQLNMPELAVPLFEQVLELRPEEPQSLRDLAHAYARANRMQEAVDALWKIITQPWDSRFPEIELIALEEMNAMIATSDKKLNTTHFDQRLVENLDLDMRVVLNWDANNCDMDLWVYDPRGEKCLYSNRETALGGWMSRDFTGGYGPEEFLLHTTMPGEYKVMVHFYGNSQQDLAGATTIQVQMISNFGRKNQKIQEVTRRLKGASEELEIGKIVF